MKNMQLDYSFFKKKRTILLAGILVGILQLLFFIVYKKQGGLFIEAMTNAQVFFRRFLLDRLLVDMLSVFILFAMTVGLRRYIGERIPGTIAEIIKKNIRYLPVLLFSLLLFVPMAILLRHLIRSGSFEVELLLKNFRHFGKVYYESLIPFSIVGYCFFNLYLSKERINSKELDNERKSSNKSDLIEVINDNGKIQIKIQDVLWIVKKENDYHVKSKFDTYLVRKTIKDLEHLLVPKGFIRVNRGAIVNKNYLYNYSYWEYDKFILRMQDESHTEFIVSRDRMKQIKGLLTKEAVPEKH